MSLKERCRRDGCDQEKGRNSIFCDQHHREQLIQVGLIRHKPCSTMQKACKGCLLAYEKSAISTEELHSFMLDTFVQSGIQGHTECWQMCLDLLPESIVVGLLEYARSHSEPRLSQPLPQGKRQRADAEARSVAVQTELAKQIEAHLLRFPSPKQAE